MGSKRELIQRTLCAWFGHTRIVNTCFGQVTCGRCGDILGDTLAGCYQMDDKVIIGHGCAHCEANFNKLRLFEKLFIDVPKGGLYGTGKK